VANKKILLIEPSYRNKYPPLGLMKIAQYHGENGKKDDVTFIKGEDKEVLSKAWDRVYVTSLFSFEFSRISKSIDFALNAVHGQADKVFVGGIAASLMNERFQSETRWRGVRFVKGLLGEAPAKSLQLDDFDEELYADDILGTPIEDLTPDYSILEQIEYTYPVNDAYFSYTSRGCVRKCKFCGVPALEGAQRDTYSLTRIVKDISKLYGEKKDLILMDNNVVASPNFRDIISEIIDLGFERGATIVRNGRSLQRRVDFNQGVDARILCKDPFYLKELSKIAIKPLRIAFDHLGVKKPYEQAIRYAADVGLTELSNYMLYNFHDTPEDLFERMRLNVTLNEELGIRIFSFPMRYQPVTRPDRGHIGDKWNSHYLRSVQIILQATHGIVSGAPKFFKTAFGDTFEEFESILIRPHHFIFNRYWYDFYEGKPELDEFKSQFSKLSFSERTELFEFLNDHVKNDYHVAIKSVSSGPLRDILHFYLPLPREIEAKIWQAQKELRDANLGEYLVPDDELVEDAGLNDVGYQPHHNLGSQQGVVAAE
jgi:hypothetical protein